MHQCISSTGKEVKFFVDAWKITSTIKFILLSKFLYKGQKNSCVTMYKKSVLYDCLHVCVLGVSQKNVPIFQREKVKITRDEEFDLQKISLKKLL